MKIKALLLMAFISSSTFAQDTQFKFSKEGLTDFVVGSFDAPAKDLYKYALGWIKENNKNPEAIKSSVENEKIIFEGGKQNFLCSKAGGTNVCSFGIYTIEISFKDGKYKFDLIDLEVQEKGKIIKPNLNDFSQYYDKDGNLKKYMNDVPASYEELFNGLNKSLLTYMEKKKKSEEW